jgi:SAM-dependent methyltransferase
MDPKARFSSRVDNYIKYRPGYPPAVLETLQPSCGLNSASRVADIGSGTGLLARLFLNLGCQVTGIEPNAEMRAAGDRLLAAYPRFTSLGGSAENTGLPDGSIDFVTAGQAFHWFDSDRARVEFRRILKPAGWVALIWNTRLLNASPFLQSYEALLRAYSSDYAQVDHRKVDENPEIIPRFFGGPYYAADFENWQLFDYDGLQGRLLSSSYAPEPGHPNYEAMIAELHRIFDRHQVDGQVSFEYETNLFYGQLV